ncbi:Bug family tripartite tricarboxylate transporter substrate binding protein [Halorarum salinum]|uniref:Tripartite tricarboxylate transporter substrate binding protein n=1 Tax=Halorarum salinum TaxID=2743089 RepID=A0A7D5L8A2_9EURY|nr:tripartite tricarboxylate transporter substrate-binding protein [Halobaculum salinum]QLG60290.1 hypothetical protein HUG12_00335 [Halobaculum salinum]
MVLDDSSKLVNRRRFVKYTGGSSIAALAGCLGGGGDDNGDGNGDGNGGGNGGGDDFPSDTFNTIVPYAEGGGSDAYARHFTAELADITGTDYQVENLPGAGATRGMTVLHDRPANGYHMGLASPPASGLMTYLLEPDRLDWDYSDFSGLAVVGRSTTIVTANPDLGIEDYEDLAERVRSGEFTTTGGPGLGGIEHVAYVFMKENHDMPIEDFVAYDGCGPTQQAVASGEIPFGICSEPSAQPFIESGDVEPIADITTSGGLISDIPSVADFGYADMDSFGYPTRCLLGPPGVPEERREALSQAFKEATETESTQQWEEETGNAVLWGDHEEAEQAWKGAIESIPEEVNLDAVREDMQE